METKHISEEYATIKIGDLVSEDFRRADAFKKFNIDFCCGGDKTVAQACDELTVDLNELILELQRVEQTGATSSLSNVNEWDMGFIRDYINNVHHSFIRNNVDLIRGYITKTASVHGESNPEVVEVNDLYENLTDDIATHLNKEEEVLFPAIDILTGSNQDPKDSAYFESMQRTVGELKEEHIEVGDILGQMAKLTNNYTPPQDACNTYSIAYMKLKEFSEDLQQHIHLENNILFPKMAELLNQKIK